MPDSFSLPYSAKRKVIGIGLWTDHAVVGLLDLVVETFTHGEGYGLFLGIEPKFQLAIGIFRTRPAHQGIGALRRRRVIFQKPARGIGAAGLHGGFGGFRNAY